jgi:hypothetical protein
MSEMINVLRSRTYRSYVLVFLAGLGLTFLGFAVAIFVLIKPLVTMRSTIDMGSFVSHAREQDTIVPGAREQSIVAPETAVKLITAEYIPDTLSVMVQKGVPAAIINALTASTADSAGRSVMIVSTIHPAAESAAREFQQNVLGQILQAETRDTESLRQRLQFQIDVAEKTVASLRQEIDALAKTADGIDSVVASVATRSDNSAGSERKNDTAPTPAPHSANSAPTGPRTFEDLALERARIARYFAEIRRQIGNQALAITKLQYSLKSIRTATVLQQPQLVPGPLNAQRLNLLFVAFVTSVLLAIVAVAVLRDFEGTKRAAGAP